MRDGSPLACLRWALADAVSARLLAIGSLEACFGTTGRESGKPTSLPSSPILGKVLGLLGKLWGRWDGMSRERLVPGGGWSRRQQTGVRGTPPGGGGGRDAGCGNSPCARRQRGRAAPLLSWVPALPDGAPCHGRPLPGGCVKASAEPRAVGVGAPRCRVRVQAPSRPCGCPGNVSHGCCCSTGQAATAQPRLTKDVSLFSAPGLWPPAAAWIQPSWQHFPWFLFSLCRGGKLEQHPCSASSWAEKPAPLPAAGTRNRPENVAGRRGKQLLLSHLVPALLWDGGLAFWDGTVKSQPGLPRCIVSSCTDPETLTNRVTSL